MSQVRQTITTETVVTLTPEDLIDALRAAGLVPDDASTSLPALEVDNPSQGAPQGVAFAADVELIFTFAPTSEVVTMDVGTPDVPAT